MTAHLDAAASGAFSRRSVVTLVTVGVGTFALGLVLAAFAGDLFGEASAGHDTYSRSLVGHRGLREVLERSGLPVVVARTPAARKARAGFPLLLLEPLATDGQAPNQLPDELPDGASRLADVLRDARRDRAAVVLVLPKALAAASPRHPGWIESLVLVPPSVPEAVLATALGDEWAPDVEMAPDGESTEDGADGLIVRPADTKPFRYGAGAGEPAGIDLPDAPQLVAHGAGLKPIVSNDDGVLVGVFRPGEGGTSLVVIADPDLLNNRGLARGDNAAVVLGVLRSAGEAEGVVIDETLHGHTGADSIVGRALRFPLVLVVIHGGLAIVLLGWSVSTRFGRALPPPPALPPGKRLLIDNTAALLQSAGDHGEAVRRYLHMAEATVARRFSVPEGTSQEAQRERLTRINGARGVPFDLEAMETAAAAAKTAAEATRLAGRIHDWQRELLGDD